MTTTSPTASAGNAFGSETRLLIDGALVDATGWSYRASGIGRQNGVEGFETYLDQGHRRRAVSSDHPTDQQMRT